MSWGGGAPWGVGRKGGMCAVVEGGMTGWRQWGAMGLGAGGYRWGSGPGGGKYRGRGGGGGGSRAALGAGGGRMGVFKGSSGSEGGRMGCSRAVLGLGGQDGAVQGQFPRVGSGATGSLCLPWGWGGVSTHTTPHPPPATQSAQWYAWGPPNMQCRLCASCWIYWKKYGGLKTPTQLEGAARSASVSHGMGYRRHPHPC